tara:strand:- start:640 stop:2667 length:2028 start_codon:yes stop_codon:yes gene_type:complete
LAKSFESVFLGAAGSSGGPSDDKFNYVSCLSHFEGENDGVNNVFDDGSTGNLTITANGNVTQGSFSPFCRADGYWGVSFDGTTDLLLAASSADFAPGTGAYTAECWVWPGRTSGENGIFGSMDAGAYGFGIWNDGTTIHFQERQDGYDSADPKITSTALVLNQWNHVAITRQTGTGGTLRAYIGGSQVGTETADLRDLTNTDSMKIGHCGGASNDHQGFISNFRYQKGTCQYPDGTSFTPSTTAPLTAVTNTKLLTCQSNRFVDNSASAHVITPSGTPSVTAFGSILTSAAYAVAVTGASALFDGVSDSLTFTNDAGLSLDGDYTLELWFYVNSIIQDTQFPSIWLFSGPNSTQLYLRPSNDYIGWYDGSDDIVKSADDAVILNQWNHVAVVRSGGGTNNTSLFLNGVRVAQATNTATLGASSGTARIGSYNGTGGDYEGYLSDIRLLKGTALYSGTTYTVPTAPLTAITNTELLLNMADAQAIDSAAQNNFYLIGNANVSTDQAKFGDASFHVPANGDYLKMQGGAEAGNFGTGDFTIEMWLYRTASGATQPIIDARSSASATNYQTHINSDNQLRSRYGGIANTSETVAVNEWVHIAIVRNGGTLTQYINGTGGGTYSSTASLSVTSSGLTLGGSSLDSGSIAGFIDDVRISKFARYTSNFTAPDEAFPDQGQ